MLQVSEIHRYPIKSCRGLAVDAARVEARGLAGDRRYMLVDERGVFLTQRQHPRMALIEVAASTEGFRVTAPGQQPLDLPLELPVTRECRVRIWRDTVDAALADAEINRWFSDYLGFDCGLVYMAEQHHRALAKPVAAFDDEVSFADGAPLLLISAASLEALNERLDEPVSMRRFRPNLVVTADAPFAEDGWQRIAVGAAEFDVAWPCTRCVLTTIDPDTGVEHAGGEPLATLRRFRREAAAVLFGQNLIPRKLGEIRVGDTVRVVRERMP